MEVRDFFEKIGDICDNIPLDDCDECPISGYCPRIGCTKYFWDMPEKVIRKVETYKRPPIGEWNERKNGYYVCSICSGFSPSIYDYCPHCGTLMNTEGEN